MIGQIAGNQQQAVESKQIQRMAGYRHMPVMYRVEHAAKNSDALTH